MCKDRPMKKLLLLMLAMAFALGGCAMTMERSVQPIPEIQWPAAPQRARIRFVKAITSPEDMQIRPGVFRRFLDFLSGRPKVSMVNPYGMETDARGRLFVVDTFLRAVHVFDPIRNRHYLFPGGKTAFLSPIDIALDESRGHIYVSDSKQAVIKIFSSQGKKLVGEIGRGVLERPTGIAVNAETDELLVVDTLAANIVRYGLRDGQFKGLFGGTGDTAGRLHFPTNISLGRDGTILVSDSLNFRVQLFSRQGRFLKAFGGVGEHPGSFSRPKGIAADSDGNIYVVDNLFDNVQIFDRNGRLLLAFGDHGSAFGQFWLPSGIFIDANDRIYVADSYNKRIQVFQYIKADGGPK